MIYKMLRLARNPSGFFSEPSLFPLGANAMTSNETEAERQTETG
jgi:hypothetical protein